MQVRYQDVSTIDEYKLYLKEEDTDKTSLHIWDLITINIDSLIQRQVFKIFDDCNNCLAKNISVRLCKC